MNWIKSTKCDAAACVEIGWTRSTKCEGGSCVEVNWTRSTRCEQGACVEVHADHEMIGVRNSQIPGEVVWFDRDEWRAFREGILAGEFTFDA